MDIFETVFVRNSLIVAFAVIGITIWFSYMLADKLTAGRIHGSAIAIALGLIAAYFGGITTGGSTGVADMALLGGIGLMGGGMMRDFAIVATAVLAVGPRRLAFEISEKFVWPPGLVKSLRPVKKEMVTSYGPTPEKIWRPRTEE